MLRPAASDGWTAVCPSLRFHTGNRPGLRAAEERGAITTLGPESYLAVTQVSSGGQVSRVKTQGPAREEESELRLYPELDLVYLKALVLPCLHSTCCHRAPCSHTVLQRTCIYLPLKAGTDSLQLLLRCLDDVKQWMVLQFLN